MLAVGQQLSVALPARSRPGHRSRERSTAEAPLLDTSAVSSGQNFDSRMVEGLPMFSNMPIMLTRFALGREPGRPPRASCPRGSLDGTTRRRVTRSAASGSNNYSIDGATNNGIGRRIAGSPNSDMIQEMRVETSNFDASLGHGTGLQISMMTRAGTNQYAARRTTRYWTNKFNELNPQPEARPSRRPARRLNV